MINNTIILDDINEIINNSTSSIPFLKNKSILITGANGMLSSYLVATFLKLNQNLNTNIKIYALVRNKEKFYSKMGISQEDNITVIEQDICKKIDLEEKIDIIFHFASSSNPQTILNSPIDIIKANTLGTYNVLEFSKKNKSYVVFSSTREIYGKTNELEAIKETDYGILDPSDLRSCYPESKRMAENMMICYNYQYNIPYCILRIAHSYGPGMIINNDGRIMADLIGNIVNRQDIILKSKGEAVRTYTYVSDAINAMFNILLNSKDMVYNIADEDSKTSIRELAETLVNIYPERNLKLVFDIPEQDKNNGCAAFTLGILSTDKIRNELGWRPKYSIYDGFKRTVDYIESEMQKEKPKELKLTNN